MGKAPPSFLNLKKGPNKIKESEEKVEPRVGLQGLPQDRLVKS